MSKKLKKSYSVSVKINLWTNVEVPAESLEEAIAIGRELNVRDVVTFDGDFNDGDIKVDGVYEL